MKVGLLDRYYLTSSFASWINKGLDKVWLDNAGRGNADQSLAFYGDRLSEAYLQSAVPLAASCLYHSCHTTASHQALR